MPSVDINGGQVAYEVVGDDNGIPFALTAGGRTSMEFPGVRPLAEKIAAGGMKVLLWDRPNCGASDIQFSGRWPTESHMHADTLSQLIRHLGWGPTVIAGGSGGARAAIATAIDYPEVARKLIVWDIVGGIDNTLSLAWNYVLGTLSAAKRGGMQAVMELPEWKERIEQNPRNHDRFLAISREEFIRILRLWLNAYVPMPGQTIPAVPDEDFARITAPAAVIRSGGNDENHPLKTCLGVHALIRGSRLLDSPWPDEVTAGFPPGGPYARWHEAAPLMIEFSRDTP